MSASRLRPTLGRGAALLALAGLAFVAWLLLFRGDGAETRERDERAMGISRDAMALARGLSVAEQIDQVLMLGFEGTGGDVPFLAEVAAHDLGAVVVGPRNGADSELLASLADAAAGEGRIPPMLVAAQEGGIYRSFPALPPQARALDLGAAGSAADVEAWAFETARALRRAGFHLNLFPVADVAPLNTPLGARVFGDSPDLVAELTGAALAGCERAELGCAPLHFPGLGAAAQDPSAGPATVGLDRAALDGRDLVPFRAAIAARAPAFVLSPALYAAYDPVTPGTLDPEIASRLLRAQEGFEGTAITPDLGAGAVKATYAVPDAAVAALRAGADLLQIAPVIDQGGVRNAIATAVDSGALPRRRLTEAAARVLDLKRRLGLVG